MHLNRISILALAALAAPVLPLSLRAATETVDGIEWTYTVSNGKASIYNAPEAAAIPGSTSGAITIPATLGGSPVTSIGNYAFSDCISVTSVTIHITVTSIGNYAFYNCSGLTTMTIPDSVTSIGNYAFEGCSGLTSVTIPDSVTSIGRYAFSGCTFLTSVTIGNSLTSIGEDAFYGCRLSSFAVGAENPSYCSANGLLLSKDGKTLIHGVNGEVEIPDSVTSIGDSACKCCFGLTSVTIPDSVTNIGDFAFAYCALSTVTIPDSVTSIGESAFAMCPLKSVTIPDTVTSIGDSAFSCGATLMSIAVGAGNPNYCSVNGLLLSKDGKSLIQGVNGDVAIPDTVTSIGDGAFSECFALTSVTIPDSVTNIGDSAFAYCGITSVSIPDSVTSLGNEVFSDCFDIQVLYLPSHFQGSTSNLSIPEDCAVGFYSVPPEAIYTVVFSANGGTGTMNPQIIACDADTALFSNAFTRVGYAFAGWATTEDGAVAYANGATVRNLAAADSSVTLYAKWAPNVYEVTLDPQGGSGGTASVAATYGSAMPAITVPTKANLRFKGYFMGTYGGGWQCYTATGASARNWDIPNNATLYALWSENQNPAFTSATPDVGFIAMEIDATEDFSVTTSDPDDDAVTVKWYLVENAGQERILAGSGNGYTFTATTAGNFRIEAEASDGTATVSTTWAVKVFPADVAEYDEVPGSGLVWSVSGTTLTISGNGPMPDYADADPPYLGYAGTVTAIVVEEGVTHVGDNAFQDFQGVESVSLPETLTSIGIGAFADCASLLTIAIPDSVETLGEGMFSGCDNLEMLYLPQWFMDSLDDLDIPDTCSVANTDVYHFVRRLYNLCLGREPEWSGCATWSKRLTSGERNGAMAAYGFFMSAEMKRRNLSNADYVEILYRAMMDRAPDSNGKAYWVDLLDNGVSRAGVFRGFAESAEFTRICGWYGITRGNVDRGKLEQRDLNYGVTKFVARCYTKALNRNYDVKGLNSWCAKINSSSTKKATAIQVAKSFLKSAEFQRRNLSNSAYVDVLYQTFLGRAPDSKGKASWLGKLNSGVGRDKVMAGFYNSREFATIMASYGIR